MKKHISNSTRNINFGKGRKRTYTCYIGIIMNATSRKQPPTIPFLLPKVDARLNFGDLSLYSKKLWVTILAELSIFSWAGNSKFHIDKSNNSKIDIIG